MIRFVAMLALVALLAALPHAAAAERLITSLSSSRVLIAANYTGAELVLFGAIEREGLAVSRVGGYDIVVKVTGPATGIVVREKRALGPIWVNADQRKYVDLPGYAAMLSTRPITDIADDAPRARHRLGLDELVMVRGGRISETDNREPEFRRALIRLRAENRLFQENPRGVVFLAANLFRAAISLPATAPLGAYEATVFLFADGVLLAQETTPFEVVKIGFEATMAMVATQFPWVYGIATVLLALFFGWGANVAFRQD
jgi:uncharacterized protein (TIGR02186 family)